DPRAHALLLLGHLQLRESLPFGRRARLFLSGGEIEQRAANLVGHVFLERVDSVLELARARLLLADARGPLEAVEDRDRDPEAPRVRVQETSEGAPVEAVVDARAEPRQPFRARGRDRLS